MGKKTIAMVCDDAYTLPCITAITSLCINSRDTTDYVVYICVNGMSAANKGLLRRFQTSPWNLDIRIVELQLEKYRAIYEDYDGNTGAGSITALAKFDLPALLAEDVVLYLDGDIIIRKDISELFEVDLGDKVAAVVRDSGKIYFTGGLRAELPKYFNSGVMLLNLKMMREEGYTEKLVAAKRALNDPKLVDQDAFNVAFKGKTKLLPIQYNALLVNLHNACTKFTMCQLNDFYQTAFSSLYDLDDNVSVLHFASKEKPWKYDDVRYADLWMEYFRKSPCAELDVLRTKFHQDDSNLAVPETVPIVLATDGGYLPQTYVAMKSALDGRRSNSEFKFYVLMPELASDADIRLFETLTKAYPSASVTFVAIGNQAFSYAKLSIAHITTPTFYRLKTPSLFPQYEKIIYLDSDVLVEGDLTELYTVPIGENYIAGVKAASYHLAKNGNGAYCERNGLPAIDQYVNAGVLLMNLRRLREDHVEEEFLRRSKLGCRCQDQDIINGACYGHIYHLPYKYNCQSAKYELMPEWASKIWTSKIFTREDILEGENRPLIIHYVAQVKPWADFSCPLADRWWKCAKTTPFYEAFLRQFADAFVVNGASRRMALLSSYAGRRTRGAAEIRKLKKKIAKLRVKVARLESAFSYRVGMFVTWPLRHAYRMLKCYCAIFFCYCAIFFAVTAGAGVNPALERADGALRGVVRHAERRDRQLTSVGLFNAAYCLLRANRGLDKLDILFAVAEEMQEKNADTATFGNFRWYWRDGYVMDLNAVDFCMQEGALIARDWRKELTGTQRQTFDRICERAIVGSFNHRVRSSYTNIALMNAANLILLGEALGRKDAFDEGVRRLDDFILTTALFGICEYASPTYTAVDLDSLHRLHEFVRDASVRDRVERLLRLFWSDVFASSLRPTGCLAGAHSRDYDYLYGRGGVAHCLRAVGFAAPLDGHRELPPLRLELSRWRPDAAIRALGETTPRYVESMWGEEPEKTRTLWTGRHVSLGVAGANYWNMDIPLAVDFAATNRLPRTYFIADGRRDPYGMKKIPEGRGPHEKTIHLHPFWAGAQRERDALGLVVYRPQDLPSETPTLESHIVFPSKVDEVLVGDSPVPTAGAAPFVRELGPEDAVFVRQGAGAFALRVIWSRDCRGRPAHVALVNDGTAEAPVCRLTVAHHDTWGLKAATDDPPGAAVFVRVSDEADDPAKFAGFRRAFAAAKVVAAVGKGELSMRVAGEAGALELVAGEPFLSVRKVVPEARRAVLAVNGRDIGAEILGEVPGVATYRQELARQERDLAKNRIVVSAKRPVRWEAEKGVVVPAMVVGEDVRASGGKFVWAPGVRGGRGAVSGSVSWQLDVKDAGIYRLWARILTPTVDDDSFCFEVRRGEYAKTKLRGALVTERTDWHTPQTQNWTWAAFPIDLHLPAGPVVLTLVPREDGAKMDSLRLTSDLLVESVD